MNQNESEALLREALHIDYRLRSTFFYRKLHELGYAYLDKEVDKLEGISRNFNWESRAEWGVSSGAWSVTVNRGISPISVFAHPRVLQEQPYLSAYYRNVAALSQKAVRNLAFGRIVQIESGNLFNLKPDEALALCRLFNNHASLIIESSSAFTRSDAIRMMLISAGTQIQGSWQNQIGFQAELVVRNLFMRAALDAGIINSVIESESGTRSNVDESILKSASLLSGIRLNNQTSILFSSEPDLSILDADGRLTAAVEVKGGKDTAGALERYGAAKKSFDEARRQNPDVTTVFLASCITKEVYARLQEDDSVHRHFNLTEILVDETAKSEFLTFIFRTLDYEAEC